MSRLGLLIILMASSASAAAAEPNVPVPALDLHRYAGTWHEIAHLPMFFQRKCVDTITATYTLLPDGTVEVRNACRNKAGGRDEAVGVARPVSGHPGQLKVRFAPAWLSWLPMAWADYWVVDLDPDYRWAVVGSPSRKYLWILSRSATMPTARFEELKSRARRRGYPVDTLVVAAPLE